MDRDVSYEEPFAAEARLSRRIIAGAIGGGVLIQALFWETGLGINWLVLVVGVVLASFTLFGARPFRAPAYVAAGGAIALAAACVLRAGTFNAVVAVPLSTGLMMTLPMLLRTRLGLGDLGALPAELLRLLRVTPAAIESVVWLPKNALAGGGRSGLRSAFNGAMLGLPVTGVFFLLFLGDPKFSALTVRGIDGATSWALFAFASGVTAIGLALFYAYERSARWSQRAEEHFAVGGPYRVPEAAPGKPPRIESPLTWTLILGQVSLVFAVFVVANFSDLFGGHDVVRAPDGPTYAAHLHAGFAQLMFATMLSLCLVLAGHKLLRPEGAAAPIGGTRVAVVECALLALTSVTLLSCRQRLAVYEDAYGATQLRLAVSFIQGAVLIAIAFTVAKSLFRSWRGYWGGLGTALVALGVVAASFNADAYVAGTNLDRVARGRTVDDGMDGTRRRGVGLDQGYLHRLSPDAAVALDHPVVQANPELRATLVAQFERYYAERDHRSFRGLLAKSSF